MEDKSLKKNAKLNRTNGGQSTILPLPAPEAVATELYETPGEVERIYTEDVVSIDKYQVVLYT